MIQNNREESDFINQQNERSKQNISLKELEKLQLEEKKKKREVYNKYLEEQMEKKNSENNNNNIFKEDIFLQPQQQENEVKNASQISQLPEGKEHDDPGRSRLFDRSNLQINIDKSQISNKGELSLSHSKKNSEIINNSISKQNSFQSDEIQESDNNLEKANSNQDPNSKFQSQSDNTQIDLDDSASSDDFFGDIFEGFMSDEDDDSGKSKKSDEEDVSDSSLAEANFQFKQVQKKKLVKKKKEYGPNYNPKLLTTNLFFQPLENLKLNRDLHHHQTKLKNTFKQAKDELKKQKYKSTGFKSPDDFKQELEYNFFQPIKEAIQEGHLKKEIIQQFLRPQSAYEYDFQGMDVHIENKLQEDLRKDGQESKPYQWAKQDYFNEEDIENKQIEEIIIFEIILNQIRENLDIQEEFSISKEYLNYKINFPNKVKIYKQFKNYNKLVQQYG